MDLLQSVTDTSDHIDNRLHDIAISIADSSSVRYRVGHISYDIVNECTSCQRRRLHLIDVACRAHRRGSLCLTFPGVDLSCSALGAWGGDWGTAVAPVVG